MGKKETLVRREGYWRSKYAGYLPAPVPRHNPWKGEAKFLLRLAIVEAKANAKHCKGSSICRLCEKINGSVTYELDGWEWPSGFAHYVRKHHVRPSLAFQEFVLGYFADGGS